MAATLETSKLTELDSVLTPRGLRVVAKYRVKVTEPTAPQQVVVLAQSATGTNDAVGVIGEQFDVTINSVQHVDAAIFLSQIQARQRLSGPEGRLAWWVTATYENPQSRPTQLDDIEPNPLLRPAEVWTEELVTTRERAFGKNREAIVWQWQCPRFIGKPVPRKAGTFGPITNAAGFRYGPIPTLQIREPVFVFKKNVSDPFAWVAVDNQFRSKVSSHIWDVYNTGYDAAAGTCRYMGIQTSRPKYWGLKKGQETLRYYELECRVHYSPDGHDVLQRNEGDKYWVLAKGESSDTVTCREGPDKDKSVAKHLLENDYTGGLPAQPPIALDAEGKRKKNQDAAVDILRFQDLDQVNFSALTSALGGLQ